VSTAPIGTAPVAGALPRIGPYTLAGRVLLAPMAGVTDPPFRALCTELGAALACGEMLSANQALWHSGKSITRRAGAFAGIAGLRAVQLAGSDPVQLADAARAQVDEGAELIDLNLGCPAKKVCNSYCGSALLSDEPLVARLFAALTRAVDVPVTAKIRTGPDPASRNALVIARLAEQHGIAALAVHGRTRAERFGGEAEYDTIRAVKAAVRIPVFANGDITTPERACAVLAHTGADGVMIGRAALGSPWIFRAVNARLQSGHIAPALLPAAVTALILRHLEALYAFHGESIGVRLARKHLTRYCDLHGSAARYRPALLAAEDSSSQFALAQRAFGEWQAAAA
jgi:tRNA-dihydrouridine synthase B